MRRKSSSSSFAAPTMNVILQFSPVTRTAEELGSIVICPSTLSQGNLAFDSSNLKSIPPRFLVCQNNNACRQNPEGGGGGPGRILSGRLVKLKQSQIVFAPLALSLSASDHHRSGWCCCYSCFDLASTTTTKTPVAAAAARRPQIWRWQLRRLISLQPRLTRQRLDFVD